MSVQIGTRTPLDGSPLDVKMHPCAQANLVVFGGIAQGVGMPPFEFARITRSLPVNRVFVRDVHQTWYHTGLSTLTSTIAETCDLLRGVIRQLDCWPTVFLGNSMGGFAALLFGEELGVEQIIAFSPQSFIDPCRKLWHGDRRWFRQLAPVYKRFGLFCTSYDLLNLLAHFDRLPPTEIYYDARHRLDAIHSERLAVVERVTLYPRRSGGHNVVKEMRDTGELSTLLHRVLARERDAVAEVPHTNYKKWKYPTHVSNTCQHGRTRPFTS